ncbi:hypothetical protein [Hydrogenovibrio kuenenii]|uniref:hypothetical protein n=1 Tax=Hydrogenovibrio kuenenii TaxID=63658 RepID=UPI000463D24F|nr:hypothetical protein [Hydrogenovibrio kuenenii]
MTTTKNTTQTAAKRPAATTKSNVTKPSAQANGQAAKVENTKSANETTTVENKVSSSAVKAEKSSSSHIADQIKGFSRRRVWPD